MIKAEDAIRTARSLIGTPYKELDCVNLVKKVIRTTTGGVPGYTTAGTNTLWRSYNATPKYRDLTWRQDGIAGARAGMLAFKASGDNVHHVGLVTGEGTVIHASSAAGETVETTLDRSWDLLGIHRYIEAADDAAESEETGVENYKAIVKLNSGTLNVRNEPGTGGDIIGRLNNGAAVMVQAEYDNGWRFISYGDSGSGYVSGEYLAPYEEPESVHVQLVFTDSAGNKWIPVGDFKAELQVADD